MFGAHDVHPCARGGERIEQSADVYLLDVDRRSGRSTPPGPQGPRAALKDQAEYFAKALGAGGSPAWMTQDEVRDDCDLNPMGGEAAKLREPTNVASKAQRPANPVPTRRRRTRTPDAAGPRNRRVTPERAALGAAPPSPQPRARAQVVRPWARSTFDCEIKLAGDGGRGQRHGRGLCLGVRPARPRRRHRRAGRLQGLPRGLEEAQGAAADAVAARPLHADRRLDRHEEDDKGLKVTGQLILDVPQAADARALIKAGAVKGLSIGYRPRTAEIDRQTGARHLKKVDLWEISPVTFPMLPEAQISGVKGDIDPERWSAPSATKGSPTATRRPLISVFRKHALRDAGSPSTGPRDGAAEMLMTLRKAVQALRD
jgi:hypothetical protein